MLLDLNQGKASQERHMLTNTMFILCSANDKYFH